MPYIYIALTVFFTVYGQLILKWRVSIHGSKFEGPILEKLLSVIQLILLDVFVLSGLMAAFAASVFWILAVSRLELSFAYPFVSSSFAIVLIFSVVFFGEQLTVYKVLGVVLILCGIIVSSQSPQQG